MTKKIIRNIDILVSINNNLYNIILKFCIIILNNKIASIHRVNTVIAILVFFLVHNYKLSF